MGEAHAAQVAQLQSKMARQGAQLAGDAEAAEKLQAVSRSQEDRILALQQVFDTDAQAGLVWIDMQSCCAGQCGAETCLTVYAQRLMCKCMCMCYQHIQGRIV